MKKLILTALTAMMTFTSACAMAATQTITREGYVLKSEPIYSNTTTSVPKKTCQVVDVPIYGQVNTNNGASAGDVLGGMIIGGILGKGVSGNDKGAAAGAVLGGMVAADKKNKTQRVIVGYQQQQQCSTTYTKTTTRVVQGYRTVVEVPSLDFYRYEFISSTKLTPRTKITANIQVNVSQ